MKVQLSAHTHTHTHDFHLVLKSNKRFDYIECIAGDSPKRERYTYIHMYIHACVLVVHICSASYIKIEFLTRSLDGGRPTQRKTSMEICIFSHRYYRGCYIFYLRSPDICMLENIFTSPPASRTDSTKLTYSFLRLTSWHL